MARNGRKPPQKKKVVLRVLPRGKKTNVVNIRSARRPLLAKDWSPIARAVVGIFREYRIENVSAREQTLHTLMICWKKIQPVRMGIRATNLRINNRSSQLEQNDAEIKKIGRVLDQDRSGDLSKRTSLLVSRRKMIRESQILDQQQVVDMDRLQRLIDTMFKELESIPAPIQRSLNSAAKPVWERLTIFLIEQTVE